MKRRAWIGWGLAGLALVGAVALDGLYAPWAAAFAAALVGPCLPFWERAPLHLSGVEWRGGALLLGGALLSLGRAVQPSMAVWGPLLLLSGLVWLLTGRLLAQRERLTLLLSGLALLPAGLILHGLWLLQAGEVHQSGRLASALGYPIALGATGLVGVTIGCLKERQAAGGILWATGLYGSGLALSLSGSRGLWVAGALTLLILLLGRPHWWRRLLLPLLTAGAVGLWMAPLVMARAPLLALLWCLGGGLFLLVARSRWIWTIVPVGTTLFAQPGWAWLLGRTHLPGTESASVERLIFLRDAWSVVVAHPLGQGFRAWASVELTAASYPYWTGEVHSALMDVLLNWGWLGGLGLLLLLGRLWWGAWALRRADDARFALVVGVGGLALHGLVDWTLSYGLFAGLVAIGLGVIPPGQRPPSLELPRPLVALLGGLLAAGTILLGAGEWAASTAREALRQGAISQALGQAELARQLAPWHEEGWAVQGEALLASGQAARAVTALERAATLAPLEPWYPGQLAEARFASGDEVGGLQAYQTMVQRQPWAPEAYDRALAAHVDRYLSATLRHDDQMAGLVREGGMELLDLLDAQSAKVPPGAPRSWRTPDSATIRKARDLF